MESNGTPYSETEVLIDVMNGDTSAALARLRLLTPTELGELRTHLWQLDALTQEVAEERGVRL